MTTSSWSALGAATVLCAVCLADGVHSEQGVRAFFRDWAAAVEAMDASRVMSFYTDDFLQSGMGRGMHRLAYTAQFALIRLKRGKLEMRADVREVRFWDLGKDAQFADVSIVVERVEILGKKRYADRLSQPMRLRLVDGKWKACGDKTRTLVLVQVAHDKEETALTLTAQSAYPAFPAVALVEGPGIKRQVLRTLKRDMFGKPYVTETVYVSKTPEVGGVYTFHIPYHDTPEHLRYRIRGKVTAIPEISAPARDLDVRRWPLTITWRDVSEQIKDFSCYEVHVRRAEDRVAVYVFRSIPGDRHSLALGETARQKAAFGEAHKPYHVEVYAYDVHGNYALARQRFYDLTGASEDKGGR